MTRIAIILGSIRPGRNAEQVGRWVLDHARDRDDAAFELVDLADYELPHLDEPTPAAMGSDYRQAHTRRWAATVDSFDGFVFITPEYNHSTTAALKNAIDFLFVEWNDKVAGFVSYGLQGGTRAVEHLKLVMTELKIANVRTQVGLSLLDDFADMSVLTPRAHHSETLTRMLDEVV